MFSFRKYLMTIFNKLFVYLELVEVCLLRGCETPLGLRVRGPSRMAGVDLTSSVVT